MPKTTTPAPVGTIPYVSATPGVVDWVPVADVITDSVPDNVQIYVSSTGNDTTGDGTPALPFATVTRALASIGATGYNETATVVLMDSIGLTPSTVLDLQVAGPGTQTYPIAITSLNTTTIDVSTVQSATRDITTGLWTLTVLDPIFSLSDVGYMIEFRSGALSTYQKDSFIAPTRLTAFITQYITPTEVVLAWNGATLPALGDAVAVIDNTSSLTFINPNATLTTTISMSRIHFNRVNITINNSIGGDSFIDMVGDVTFSGVRMGSFLGSTNISTDRVATTYQNYNTSVTLDKNTTSGIFLFGSGGAINLTKSEGGALSLLNSGASTTNESQINTSNGGCTINTFYTQGPWAVTLGGNSIATNFEIQGALTAGKMVANGPNITVSNGRIDFCTEEGFYSIGGGVTFSNVDFASNAIHYRGEGASCNANFELCSFTGGSPNSQLFLLNDGATVNVQGSISTLTTVAGVGLSGSPIALLNGSELFLSGDLTLTGSPSRACYIEGYSKLQCNNLTLTCTANDCLTLDSGASIDCQSLNVTSGNSYGLNSSTAELNCNSANIVSTSATACLLDLTSSVKVATTATITSTSTGDAIIMQNKSIFITGGTLTCSGTTRAISLQTGSNIACNNLVCATTALTGTNIYIANFSSLTARGDATINSRGTYSCEVTYGGIFAANIVTITGNATTTRAVEINNRGVAKLTALTIVGCADGVSLSSSELTIVEGLAVTGQGTGNALISANASQFTCRNFTADNVAFGVALTDGNVTVANNMTVTNSQTGVSISAATLSAEGTVNITGSTRAVTMGGGSRILFGPTTTNCTHPTNASINITTLASFICQGLNATSVARTLNIDTGEFISSGAVTLNSTTSSSISVVIGSFQTRQATIFNQVTNSTFDNAKIFMNTPTVVSSAGSSISINLCEISISGTMNVTATALAVWNNSTIRIGTGLISTSVRMQNSTMLIGGDVTISSIGTNPGLFLVSSLFDVLGSVTITSPGAIGISSSRSRVSVAGTFLTVTAGATTALSLARNSQLIAAQVNINGSGTGLSLQDNSSASLAQSMDAANSTATAIVLNRNCQLALGNLDCSGSALGVDLRDNSMLTAFGAITANDTLNTPIRFDRSIAYANTLSLLSAAGIGASQLVMISSRLAITGNLNVSRTVIGTTGSPVISMAESNLVVSGTLTMLNSGGPLLVSRGSSCDISTLSASVSAGTSHIRVIGGSRFSVRTSGTITGAGATVAGMEVGSGSSVALTSTTFSNPCNVGPGIKCIDSRLGLVGCTFNNCNTSGSELTNSKASFSAVTGSGNGGFGVNLIALSQLSVTNVTTVSGVSGDLSLGARGAKTWANVATGQGQHTSDYDGTANQNRNCSVNQV